MVHGASLAGTSALLGAVPLISAAASAALLLLVLPWLKVHAVVHPGARSSHRQPTPQGAGVAVVTSTLAVTWGAATIIGPGQPAATTELLALTAATVVLAIMGAIDDLRGLAPVPRLLTQCVIVAALLWLLPDDRQIFTSIPWWVERAALLVAAVWFVNLVNFMDGIDSMTVAETLPVTAAIAVMGLIGVVAWLPLVLSLALLGAIAGFAPFNRPIAKVFLGDVGSVPIGLLLGWLLLHLAWAGHWAAALLLPMYYLVDATVTLLRRAAAGKSLWEAHRTHFYQIATDRGYSVPRTIGYVFALNVVLATLALTTVAYSSAIASTACLGLGLAAVGWVLLQFANGRQTAG